jgi:hypothetical protein
VRLVPTTTASAGAHYVVRYTSDGRVQFTEIWNVPPSTTVLKLKDVRSTTGGTGPGNIAGTAIGDVAGLTDELGARPVKGFSFVPSRTLTSNANGGIDAVQGNLSDCVHVDGTAGPCGAGANNGSFVDSEVPTGSLNGVNAAFTLSQTPSPSSSVLIFRNGVLQKQGLDYTINGALLTFASASIPQAADTVLAAYRTGSSTGNFIDAEVPGGTLNGTNRTFTLVQTPNPASSLSWYRNGILQKQGVDYTLSGGTILAAANAVPQSGDTLLAYYRTDGTSANGGQANAIPQVICSSNGSSTSSSVSTQLGSCTFLAGLLQAGDRVDVLYDFFHAGSTAAPAIAVRWGATSLVSIIGSSADSFLTGRSSLSIHQAGAQFSSQSQGTAAAQQSTGNATDSLISTLTIGFFGSFTGSTSDQVGLRGFTVIRYPAQTNP